MRADAIAPYAPAAIKLLQGVVYHDDTAAWDVLLTHQTAIQDYFAKIGVEVFVAEADGFAYLRQPDMENDAGERMALPHLTRRDKLSYSVTLLCVLLRERLDQFDASASESDRLIVTLEQLRELARAFFPERNDERALFRKIDSAVERVVDLGFLKRLGASGDDERFEVRRILKARIDADKLADIKKRLKTYVQVDS
jgi:Domain of unknown function (DUF4194)